MNIIKLEKFKPHEGITNSLHPRKRATTPLIQMRKTDWQALLQHDGVTGKLDLKSKAVLQDPACVKRLLEGKMIDAYGKLTAAGKKKCAEFTGKLEYLRSSAAASAALLKSGKKGESGGEKGGKLTASDWAVLMKYSRKTGNLLTCDPKTGRLDDGSRAILRDPSIIQRLIDNNMVLAGGWLTPQAKMACARIRENPAKKTANGYLEPRPQFKDRPKNSSEQGVAGCFEGESRDISAPGRKIDPLLARWPKDEDLQKFFENLSYADNTG